MYILNFKVVASISYDLDFYKYHQEMYKQKYHSLVARSIIGGLLSSPPPIKKETNLIRWIIHLQE